MVDMPEVTERLHRLASLQRAAEDALVWADACEEHMIGIKFEECLQAITERIRDIEEGGNL
jgi:hypothetical protein